MAGERGCRSADSRSAVHALSMGMEHGVQRVERGPVSFLCSPLVLT